MITIYGLIDPRNQQLKYVGMTSKELLDRLDKHMRDEKHSHKRSWIQGLKKCGLKPDIFEIDVVDESDWENAEKFWINYFKFVGCKLTNMADGGMGGRGNSGGRRRKRTPEQIERMRQAALGHKTSDETKEKLRKMFTGRKFSEESIEKMRTAQRARRSAYSVTDETRKRMSKAHKGRGVGRHLSDDAKKKISDAGKAWWIKQREAKIR